MLQIAPLYLRHLGAQSCECLLMSWMIFEGRLTKEAHTWPQRGPKWNDNAGQLGHCPVETQPVIFEYAPSLRS